MPNRILREGILSSERVDQLSAEAEVFYRRLMSVVDDFGRFTANPKLLISACYPLRAGNPALINSAAVATHLQSICDAKLAVVYDTGDGKLWLQLSDFKQQVRATKSKCPAPDNHLLVTCVASAHLGGVGDVSVSGGGGGKSAPPDLETKSTAKTETGSMPAHVRVATWLRSQGLTGCNADNPKVVQLAQEGVTEQEIVEAVRIARIDRGKGEKPFHFSYVLGIITDIRHPPRPAGDWWKTATDSMVLDRARAVGVATIGLMPAELKRRILEKEATVSRGTKAAPGPSLRPEPPTDGAAGWAPGPELPAGFLQEIAK